MGSGTTVLTVFVRNLGSLMDFWQLDFTVAHDVADGGDGDDLRRGVRIGERQDVSEERRGGGLRLGCGLDDLGGRAGNGAGAGPPLHC